MWTGLQRMLACVRAFFSAPALDRELDQEFESHVEMLTDENIRRGMPPDEARRDALVRMGARESMKEQHRELRGLPFLETLVQDLRYTVRTLRRDAGFATFAILIVGIGIGASCTIFSVVNTLLLRPLPFRDPASLVWVANRPESGADDLSGQTVQVDYMLDLRERSQSFSDLAAYFAFYGIGDANLIGQGEPERLTNIPVSQNFFPLLGVNPILGRQFTEQESHDGGPHAVMLSYALWQRRFNSDPAIAGRSMNLDGTLYTIVGVLPESFDFGNIFAPGTHVDLFSPFPLNDRTNREGNTLAIVGRLKPGAGVGSAQAEASALAVTMHRDHPNFNGFVPQLSSLSQHVSGRVRSALILLACAVGVVMLIVCANLSNLLLARGASRQKEIAIRSALGATKSRLVRQMLTESIVLSCAGAALGLLLAIAGARALSHLSGVTIPLLESVHVDGASLAFTITAALVTGLFFGLVPALHVPGPKLHDSLKDAGRGSSAGRSNAWIRNALVISEVALACVLVVGAGLLIHSFLRVLDVDLGFHPERAVAVRIDPDPSLYSTQEKRNAYFNEALQRVLDIPGVEAAGLSDSLPLGHNRTWWAGEKGRVYSPSELPLAFVRIVSDGYLRAMGIPLRAGRDFTPADTPATEHVLLVNETLAQRTFPGGNALGKVLQVNGGSTIVGIVGDVRHLALEESSGSEMYVPIRQTTDPTVELVVRSSLSNAEINSRLRETLQPIAPDLSMSTLRTLQSLVDKSVSPRRFVMMLLGGFAAFALILASLGIYAVVSYSVSQRTQEIGIRMALGASARGVQTSILWQTLRLAAIGMAIGIAASWTLAGALRSLLFGVNFSDPATFAAMLVILTAVAALAGYLPARRASRIDPITAMRCE